MKSALQTMRLEDRLVDLWLIHAEVRQQFAALRNHAKQTLASIVIFLVLLEVLCHLIDPIRQDRNLHCCRAGIFFVSLMLLDQGFLLGTLERHKRWEQGEKRIPPGPTCVIAVRSADSGEILRIQNKKASKSPIYHDI